VDRDAHALASALNNLAVIGGGWAGLAAAVRATQAGHRVTVFEMAPQFGGRAREVLQDGVALDNGQHILIGAYRECLDLMATVGVDLRAALYRQPLVLRYPDGAGLSLPEGPALLAFARGVASARGWSLGDRWSLLRAATQWFLRGFRARPNETVADLTRHVSPAVRALLFDPLCVAALNTPAEEASAQVFLRVLKDALFSGAGSADLVLPRCSLSALWPEPARQWLAQRGAQLRLTERVQQLNAAGKGWHVGGQHFDAAVLACSPNEAARLTSAVAPAWSAQAAAFDYEPIVTVYLRSPGTRWPLPMLALRADDQSPAQFAFDLGALDPQRAGLFALVISGARAWVDRGLEATQAAAMAQAHTALQVHWRSPPQALRTLCEKRATFKCTPGLQRPATQVAPALAAVGDYVQGPYPATLEGAVRSVAPALAHLFNGSNGRPSQSM
jgi:hydroxysqualene dehydroxylase